MLHTEDRKTWDDSESLCMRGSTLTTLRRCGLATDPPFLLERLRLDCTSAFEVCAATVNEALLTRDSHSHVHK